MSVDIQTLSLAELVMYPVVVHFDLCAVSTAHQFDVVNCTLGHIFLIFFYLHATKRLLVVKEAICF